MREIKGGSYYRHFKGTTHKVIAIAKHSETLEDMVIYTHEGTDEVWARPYSLFNSLVDTQKYPQVEQKYRFEEVQL